jgi:hypothetical protein
MNLTDLHHDMRWNPRTPPLFGRARNSHTAGRLSESRTSRTTFSERAQLGWPQNSTCKQRPRRSHTPRCAHAATRAVPLSPWYAPPLPTRSHLSHPCLPVARQRALHPDSADAPPPGLHLRIRVKQTPHTKRAQRAAPSHWPPSMARRGRHRRHWWRQGSSMQNLWRLVGFLEGLRSRPRTSGSGVSFQRYAQRIETLRK